MGLSRNGECPMSCLDNPHLAALVLAGAALALWMLLMILRMVGAI